MWGTYTTYLVHTYILHIHIQQTPSSLFFVLSAEFPGVIVSCASQCTSILSTSTWAAHCVEHLSQISQTVKTLDVFSFFFLFFSLYFLLLLFTFSFLFFSFLFFFFSLIFCLFLISFILSSLPSSFAPYHCSLDSAHFNWTLCGGSWLTSVCYYYSLSRLGIGLECRTVVTCVSPSDKLWLAIYLDRCMLARMFGVMREVEGFEF